MTGCVVIYVCFWYHCICLDIEVSYTKAVNYFHCVGCVEYRFVPFLRYLAYHSVEGMDFREQSDIGKLYQVWYKKSTEEKKAIMEQPVSEKTKQVCLKEEFKTLI